MRIRKQLRLTRLIFSLVISAAGVLFVVAYDDVQSHNATVARMKLPASTHWCHRAALPALVFPAALLAIGDIARRRHATLLLEIVIQTGWLFGLAWPLTTVFVWQLPYMFLNFRF